MSALFIALPVALVLVGLALVAFAGSVRGGQFEDLETPPLRMLFDDVPSKEEPAGTGPARPSPDSVKPLSDNGIQPTPVPRDRPEK